MEPVGQTETDLLGLYDLLDRYEELLEDMTELEVTSTVEIEQKIVGLNETIDSLEETDK